MEKKNSVPEIDNISNLDAVSAEVSFMVKTF